MAKIFLRHFVSWKQQSKCIIINQLAHAASVEKNNEMILRGCCNLVARHAWGACAERRGGSNPLPRTRIELDGFSEAKMQDARSASQGFPPIFPNEFRIFGALARTNFSPRSRFEIRSNFDIVFALIQKEFLPCLFNLWYTEFATNRPIAFLIAVFGNKSEQLGLSHQGRLFKYY